MTLGLGGLALSPFMSACSPPQAPGNLAVTSPTEQPVPSTPAGIVPGELVEINLRAGSGRFKILPGAETRVWHYQADLLRGLPASLQIPPGYLGPILRLTRGQVLRVYFENHIKEPSTIHWHGLSVPAEMDGHPRDTVDDGSNFIYEFPILNHAGTYWFHPHPHQRSGPQAYYGLAGLLIISDEQESALSLPEGEFDIPLVIQDRIFDTDNQLVYAGDSMSGVLGNRVLVNGQVDTHLEVSSSPYRLRLLNGSNARIYKLAWDDGTPLTAIATDGGLLEQPVSRSYLTLAPGERVELFVDFSTDAIGQQRRLISQVFESTSSGMGGMMGWQVARVAQGARLDVAEFEVTRSGQPGPGLPGKLASPGFLNERDAVNSRRPRRFDLTMHMSGLINGRTFEMDAVAPDEVVKLGDLEIWEFANQVGGMGMMSGVSQPHPMHIHGVQFQVLDRRLEAGSSQVYKSLSAGLIDSGWKDTVLVMPGEVVRVLVKFEHYPGQFLYHCHNLEHEDGGMMRNDRVES